MSLVSYKRRLVLGAGLAVGAMPLACAAPDNRTLRIVTSHLPPLVMENGGARPGALRELVEELCRRMGLTPALDFVPWKRAVFLATKASATAVFPLTRVPEREAQYRWLALLFEENYVFLAPRGRSFDVRQVERMKDKRIAMIRGSAQPGILKEMGYHTIVEARSIDEVHRFLVQGMADASLGELTIIRNSLRDREEVEDFDISEPVRKTGAWLAGSLDFTEADAAHYQRAMKEMVADGTHNKILKRYKLA
jgi:polar amino acid transport system substrate-binding protein